MLTALLSACSSKETKTTLRSLDQAETYAPVEQQQLASKSREEIRNAYKRYLSSTPKSDKSRQVALNRLAELEFEVSNNLTPKQDVLQDDLESNAQNDIYSQQIDKSIELFKISLNDYPNAKDNDKLLYQLAKAYDQKGDSENSFNTLLQIASKYPKSRYYVETQFRIGEHYFVRANYMDSEQAYSEVITSPKNQIFYERALFKRGWSRFKQAYYEDAIEDYLLAVTYHNFGNIKTLDKSEKERFEEYFRAIGLSFSQLGGVNVLNEYFQDNQDYQYLYHTYSVISDIYLKQERYSDSVNVLSEFIKRYPKSENKPDAQLKIVNSWQKSGFSNNLFAAIEELYQNYHFNSNYWKNRENTEVKLLINQSLKDYVLLMSEHFHALYQKSKQHKHYNSASKWYRRFLETYESYARKDNIYFRYAELFRENQDLPNALTYYELAAFDEELILDKKSAYSTIILTNQLYKTSKGKAKIKYLNKHINYATLFAQLYNDDKRVNDVIANAAQLAYSINQYENTIKLANLMAEKQSTTENSYKVNTLKAQSYFKLAQYPEAESAYSNLLSSHQLNQKSKDEFLDRLALSIYRQATLLQKQNNQEEASHHFMRISDVAKSSEIAATGMYDAIALFIKNEQWDQSVDAIKRFQLFYPKHKYNPDLTKKLSVAYLNSDRKLEAAKQFEKISSFENNRDIKMTALWQAAELYESKNNHKDAVRSYTKYANTYKKPYAQNMEAMLKLTELYTRSNSAKLKRIWQNRILKADKSSAAKDRNSRTSYIASITALQMARDKETEFSAHKLIAPLQSNLKRKKKAMQQAVQLYGRASAYGIQETTTESTYAIAKIYQEFSQALLDSERPTSLSADELEQYNILLEDQAFPFEDKAIEFYEINLSRIKDEVFDDWVGKSLAELKLLFPVKYARKGKIDGYIESLY